jgi:biotin carboxyl carrier protein
LATQVVSPALAKNIKAPIAGTVSKIEVKAGDKVFQGMVVAILDNQQILMPISAEYDGVVDQFLVEEGQAVTKGTPVVRLR